MPTCRYVVEKIEQKTLNKDTCKPLRARRCRFDGSIYAWPTLPRSADIGGGSYLSVCAQFVEIDVDADAPANVDVSPQLEVCVTAACRDMHSCHLLVMHQFANGRRVADVLDIATRLFCP